MRKGSVRASRRPDESDIRLWVTDVPRLFMRACFLCRFPSSVLGHAQGLVDAAEVVPHEVQATAASRFSTLLLRAFVRRVKQRMDTRIVRFWRSTKDVETCVGFGLPVTRWRWQPVHAV